MHTKAIARIQALPRVCETVRAQSSFRSACPRPLASIKEKRQSNDKIL